VLLVHADGSTRRRRGSSTVKESNDLLFWRMLLEGSTAQVGRPSSLNHSSLDSRTKCICPKQLHNRPEAWLRPFIASVLQSASFCDCSLTNTHHHQHIIINTSSSTNTYNTTQVFPNAAPSVVTLCAQAGGELYGDAADDDHGDGGGYRLYHDC
jgi:hypothetical protein